LSAAPRIAADNHYGRAPSGQPDRRKDGGPGHIQELEAIIGQKRNCAWLTHLAENSSFLSFLPKHFKRMLLFKLQQSGNPKGATGMRLSILPYDGFTALDMIGGYEVLSRIPGMKVEFVGENRGIIAADRRALQLGIEYYPPPPLPERSPSF
jgi:hypothetical protein